MQNDVADQVVIFEPDNSLNIVLFKRCKIVFGHLGAVKTNPEQIVAYMAILTVVYLHVWQFQSNLYINLSLV